MAVDARQHDLYEIYVYIFTIWFFTSVHCFAVIIMTSWQIPKHICFKHVFKIVGEIQRTFKEIVV